MNKETVIDIIKDAGYCILATTDRDTPKARPMAPYLKEDGDFLLAVFPHSRTISQVKANPNIEMCFVDRKMSFVRVAGTGKLSDNIENKEIIWNNVPALKQYFSGPQDPNFILIEIDSGVVEAMTTEQKAPEALSLK